MKSATARTHSPNSLQVALTADWQNGGFGVYIHWPFCQAKCPYCDFNSHVSREVDQQRWLKAYLKEIDRAADETPGRILNTVFFGGGTPSLMDPDVVAAIIDRIRSRWQTVNDLEITLEANPGSVEAGKFRAFAQGGVNRVSMGVQALNDRDLQRLGRIHSVAEARAAFDIARNQFERVSFDLIYARQDQTLSDWRSELSEALAMAVDHLSLYQLTIEDGTAFADRYARGGLKGLPIEDTAADMYDVTQEVCTAHGLDAYEVSNHAKPGSASRHNLIYWRYGDYVGIGPGAHGRLTVSNQKHATVCWSNPMKWLTNAEEMHGEKPREALSLVDQRNEYLMMGLRIDEGINISRLEMLGQQPLDTRAMEMLTEHALVTTQNGRLMATARGRLLLNSVIAELLIS